MPKCHFHPDREATYTDVVVDPETGTTHTIAYKRVPICWVCAYERRLVNTSRIEPIRLGLSEPNFFTRA